MDNSAPLDAATPRGYPANRPGGGYPLGEYGPPQPGQAPPALTRDQQRAIIDLETKLKQLQAANGSPDLTPTPNAEPEILNVTSHAHDINLIIADLLTYAQDLQRENWRLRDRLRALEQAAHIELDEIRSQIVTHADQMSLEQTQHEPHADSMPPFTVRGRT